MRSVFFFLKETYTDVLRIVCSPKEGIKSVYGVSLYRNAIYLMINSGLTAILGFVFWIVVARLYPPKSVGLSSALISMVGLLSFTGTLGLGFGIIRFLPSSSDKARFLNSSFTASFLASVVVTLVFLVGLPLWPSKLMFGQENPFFVVAFIVFVVATAFYNILIQVFISFRRAEFTLVNGIIFGSLAIALVVALATTFRTFGIFVSWGIAMAVSAAVNLFFFCPQVLYRYRPLPCFQRRITNEMIRFCFANYVGQILWNLPTWILPPMIVILIGAEANAYFYVTWGIAVFLLSIPTTTSLSFFAEGSHREGRLGTDLKRSLKLVTFLLIPVIIIVFLFGKKFLLLFGREYSERGTYLLYILALATAPASINFLYLGVVRVEKRIEEIIFISSAIALGTLVLSYLLLPHLGIPGAGIGWLTSQTMVALVVFPRLKKKL